MTTARLDQILVDTYPTYDRALIIYAMALGVMALLSPDGRRLMARILDASAYAMDALITKYAYTLVAPQLMRLGGLAQNCRDLSAQAIRYADASLGAQSLQLTPQSRAALVAFESNDIVRGISYPLDPVRDYLKLVGGISIV